MQENDLFLGCFQKVIGYVMFYFPRLILFPCLTLNQLFVLLLVFCFYLYFRNQWRWGSWTMFFNLWISPQHKGDFINILAEIFFKLHKANM